MRDLSHDIARRLVALAILGAFATMANGCNTRPVYPLDQEEDAASPDASAPGDAATHQDGAAPADAGAG